MVVCCARRWWCCWYCGAVVLWWCRVNNMAAQGGVLVLVVLCTSPSKVEGKPWSHTNINCLNSAYWPGRTNDPDSCLFGWVADSCHVMFCAKGPREMCGGKNNRYGLCGEGLMCGNCDR